jgi:hypothetical protein
MSDDFDDEPFKLEPATIWSLDVEVNSGGPVIHKVSAYFVPSSADDSEVKAAINYWFPTEYCHHDHDCCGNFYAREGRMIDRTYGNDGKDVVIVMQTHEMNV